MSFLFNACELQEVCMLEFFWGGIHRYFAQSKGLVEEIVQQTETQL